MHAEATAELMYAEEQREQSRQALDEAEEAKRKAAKFVARRERELAEADAYRDQVIQWATGKLAERPMRQQRLDLEGQDRGDTANVGVLHVLGKLSMELVDRLRDKGIETVGALKDAFTQGNGNLVGFLPAECSAIVASIAKRRRVLDSVGE